VSCHPFCMTYGDTMRVQGAGDGGRGGGGVPPAAAAQVLLPRSALHRELLLPEGQGAGVDLPPARQGKPQQLPRAVVLPRSRSLVVKRKAFTPPFASKNLHFPFFDPLIFNETVEHLTFMVKKEFIFRGVEKNSSHLLYHRRSNNKLTQFSCAVCPYRVNMSLIFHKMLIGKLTMTTRFERDLLPLTAY
jgi:hypothetical protein